MDYSKFENLLGDWGSKLRSFIESEAMDSIYGRLKEDSKEGRVICPQSTNTFRAFELCPFSKLKVVILSMDPYPQYYNRTYTADGLAFSCSITDKTQPSLRVLYEAMEDDLYGGFDLNHQKVNDLSYLAEQGVLLLNTALTVEANKIGSHSELWKPFTRYVIEEVICKYNVGVPFIMMGEKAQYFTQFVNPLAHWVFEVEHPSFANRRDRPMKHMKVFSKVNRILKDNNGEDAQINWLKKVKD